MLLKNDSSLMNDQLLNFDSVASEKSIKDE